MCYSHTLHIFGLIGKKQPLEKIQNNALRFFFGLGTAAPLAALLGDSGWPPIQLHLQFTMLKYWFRVCSMSSERVPKQAFLWSRSLSDPGKVTWASHASDLLDRLDLHISSPDGLQSNKFYDCLWDALANKFLQNWFKPLVMWRPPHLRVGANLHCIG